MSADDATGPRQDMHQAGGDDLLQGILAQVAGDSALNPELDVRAALRDRLTDQGVEASDADIERLVASIGTHNDGDNGPFVQQDD